MCNIMTMGEYIKKLRLEHEWSQEEFGQKLEPKVNRAAVNKWETGQVENIKRTHINQLSKLFGVNPCELMCFESKVNEEQVSQEVKVLEQIQKLFGKDAVEVLRYFNELNDLGRQKALEDLGDLVQLSKYTETKKKELLNA